MDSEFIVRRIVYEAFKVVGKLKIRQAISREEERGLGSETLTSVTQHSGIEEQRVAILDLCGERQNVRSW